MRLVIRAEMMKELASHPLVAVENLEGYLTAKVPLSNKGFQYRALRPGKDFCITSGHENQWGFVCLGEMGVG